MRSIIYSLSEGIERHYSHRNYLVMDQGDTSRERMKALLMKAVREELTQRQRDCILKFYCEQKSAAEIAQELSIRPTTVYKHLKTARRTLCHYSEYFSR